MIPHVDLPQVVAGGVLICTGLYYFLSRRPANPPGPRGWPIIGNLLDAPTEFEWLHWGTYRKLYGPVSYTSILGREIVILNTLEACNDMLEKRSAIYSGRPVMPFAGEIVGWDQQLALAPYGKHFRTMRKLAHNHIGTKAGAAAYYEVQETEVKYLISRLHKTPNGEDLVKNLRTSIGAILLRLSHGYIADTEGIDPVVNFVEIAAQDFYHATKPGVWLVDILPWLKYVPAWMPGAGFKTIGA
jgi:hypothetical protein